MGKRGIAKAKCVYQRMDSVVCSHDCRKSICGFFWFIFWKLAYKRWFFIQLWRYSASDYYRRYCGNNFHICKLQRRFTYWKGWKCAHANSTCYYIFFYCSRSFSMELCKSQLDSKLSEFHSKRLCRDDAGTGNHLHCV